MTMTLVEYSKLQKDPLRRGLMIKIAQAGIVADLLRWRNVNGMSETGTVYNELPSGSYIPLDGTIVESTAKGHQITATVSEYAQHIDIPAPLEDLDQDSLSRPSVVQIELATKAAAIRVNDEFINGDKGTDPNGFDGLNKIVSNLASDQTIGATSIDISTYGADSATRQSVIDRVEEGMYAVDGHLPDAGFANDTFLLKFGSILRREGLLGDNFNWKESKLNIGDPRATEDTASMRPHFVWRGVPFYDLGMKTDQSTRIIGNTYTEGGSTAAATRVFFAKTGVTQLDPIQAQPLTVTKIGMLEAKDNYRWRLKWIHGLANWGPRTISKIQGIEV